MTSQVAITLLKSLEQSLDSYCELNDEGKTAFSMAISALELFGNSEQLPSVQLRKGKWIPVDSYSAFGGDGATWMAHGNPVAFYYCSECKEQAYAGEDGESLITEYCPNCGADMRGEEE